ncbi:hypothetical protein [Hydrogenimonas urashimensis]|uniref:hypothetical protein n=1 Tax=Hydrogenimonas urashimensis TaxID=2740515 RepID=UPI001916AE6B|nr:hypothetical protein [Hydrogenimonas urashimensis]
MKPSAELLVVGVASPILVGIYENKKLRESFRSEEKMSKALPPILHDVRYRYDLEALYYTKGPGSFMAIKVAYVMLQTFSTALNIPLYATDAFAFNDNAPIKAIGTSCFVKKGGAIVIEKGCPKTDSRFVLPARLESEMFSDETDPLYILPAV